MKGAFTEGLSSVLKQKALEQATQHADPGKLQEQDIIALIHHAHAMWQGTGAGLTTKTTGGRATNDPRPGKSHETSSTQENTSTGWCSTFSRTLKSHRSFPPRFQATMDGFMAPKRPPRG